ncbi:MAG: regulatory iron-sulfur-containing complex subunit RicT [Dysgonomonas sp.]
MNLDINRNNKNNSGDCLGTCRTEEGCTCGQEKPKKEELQIQSKSNACTCGKNPGGECGCKTGEGCATTGSKVEKNCGDCSKKGRCTCLSGAHKLEVYDWLCDLPEAQNSTQMVEVQFKNTRKGYYLNSNNLELLRGDIVAVEATPGHDIGEVTLTGKLVLLQMKKSNYRAPNGEIRRVYRIAKQTDIEKYETAKALEHKTMLRAREIAEELGLQMKISDVEYQGDGNKAIFYYIADERVDFRQLIKVYAEKFKVKIEMKQIGARQEAGRVGGIGPCGRELCCSSSISSFVSVSTSAARFQDISLNPQKLAGQCGKLKCCLNYEVDVYVEAQRKLPSRDTILETKDSSYFHFKTDILSGQMIYSTDKNFAANLVSVDKERVFEIIRMNRKGNKPLSLQAEGNEVVEKPASADVLEGESITRFDNNKKKNRQGFKSKDNRDRGEASNGNQTNQSGDNRNRDRGDKRRNDRDNRGNNQQQRPQDRADRPQNQSREASDGGDNNGQKKNFRRNNKSFRNNNGKNNSNNKPAEPQS